MITEYQKSLCAQQTSGNGHTTSFITRVHQILSPSTLYMRGWLIDRPSSQCNQDIENREWPADRLLLFVFVEYILQMAPSTCLLVNYSTGGKAIKKAKYEAAACMLNTLSKLSRRLIRGNCRIDTDEIFW